MKKIFTIVTSLIISVCIYAQPTVGTTNFQYSTQSALIAQGPCTVPKTATTLGWTFTISSAVNCGVQQQPASLPGSDGAIVLSSTGFNGRWLYGIIESSDGSEFKLINLNMGSASATVAGVQMTFVGYKNGSAVPGASLTSAAMVGGFSSIANNTAVDFTGNSAFNDIDKIVITPSASFNTNWSLLDITIGSAVPSTTPSFTGSTTLSLCQNTSAISINSNLAITDAATSGSETWTITTAPTHGTLGGFSTSAVNGTFASTANGGALSPSGLTYIPTNGYSGSDNFTVSITNASGGTATQTITVTIKATSSSNTNLTIISAQLPYTWNGLTFNAAGSQTKTGLTNAVSCDSSATLNLTVVDPPTITSFTPTSGTVGTTVTISGNYFNTTPANNIVFFGNTQATVTSATATSLVVTVPAGAAYSPLSVLNSANSRSCLSSQFFNPVFSPAKTSFGANDFESKVDFNSPATTRNSAVGDFDNDGKTDIVAVNSNTNSISIFKNSSTVGSIDATSFSTRIDVTVGSVPTGCAVADFDGDGKLDIVVVNSGNGPANVTVLKNVSSTGVLNSSSFVRQDYALNITNFSAQVAVGDFDNDGRTDFAVANIGDYSVTVFRNTCSAGVIDANSFTTRLKFSVGNQPQPICVADMDGDGKLDIITGNRQFGNSNVTILRNSTTAGGTISFDAKQNFACGNGPYGLAVGDINGDGKIDIITGNSNDQNVSILINNSTSGSITSTSMLAPQNFSVGYSIQGVSVGDLDGDGKLDIALSTFNSTKSLSILKNNSSNGSVSFASKVDFAVGTLAYYSSIADFDNDGKPDIVSANNNSYISVLRNAEPILCTPTTGTFTTSACGSYIWAAKGNKVYTASNITDTIHLTNAGGCDSVVTLNLTINTATHNLTTQTQCGGNYSWNGQNYTSSGTYTYSYNNANSCASIDTLKLTINQPSSSTSNVSVCSNQLPYSWNGNSYTTSDTYLLHLTNAAGCDSAATLVLSVNTSSASSVSIAASANNVCANTNVVFTATPVNGGTAPIYQWKKNGVNVGTNSNTYSSFNLANNDIVSCVLTSNSACATNAISNSNAVTMIIKPIPAIGTSSGGNICGIGGTLSVYNTNTLNGGVWSSSNTNVATVSTASNGAGGLAVGVSKGSTTLTYTKTNSNGCSVSASSTVTVVNPIITGSSTICRGNTAQLSVTETGGYWASNNNKASISSTGLVTGVNAGIASINYVVGGCVNTNTFTPTIVAPPTPPTIGYAAGSINPQLGATPSSAYCNNKTFTLVGTPAGGVWSSTNPSVVTVASGGVVSTVGVGSGSVVYTITNASGCSNNRSIVGNVVGCAPRGVNTVDGQQLVASSDFTMYPNPAKTFVSLNVETLIGKGSIVVTDLYGKTVKTQLLSMGTNTVDIANLSKGMYFVSTITNEGKTTKKLIVE